MLKKELEKIVGGLSKPSKMPGPAYNLPAYKCITGQKLAQVPGSVCHGCYALKGRYRFNNVKSAMERRLEALKHPGWVDAMIQLIKPHKEFRWHDSGDLQSLDHLKNIFRVCKGTPETKHWLPTREAQILKRVKVKARRPSGPGLQQLLRMANTAARRQSRATNAKIVDNAGTVI